MRTIFFLIFVQQIEPKKCAEKIVCLTCVKYFKKFCFYCIRSVTDKWQSCQNLLFSVDILIWAFRKTSIFKYKKLRKYKIVARKLCEIQNFLATFSKIMRSPKIFVFCIILTVCSCAKNTLKLLPHCNFFQKLNNWHRKI